MPLSFVRKCDGSTCLNPYRFARQQAIEQVISYISGPRNIEADAMSRVPMLGPLEPNLDGIEAMVKTLLRLLPSKYRQKRNLYVHAGKDAAFVEKLVKDWSNHSRVRIVRGGLAALTFQADKPTRKLHSFDLAVVIPKIPISTTLCAALFLRGLPFACLVDSPLLQEIPR